MIKKYNNFINEGVLQHLKGPTFEEAWVNLKNKPLYKILHASLDSGFLDGVKYVVEHLDDYDYEYNELLREGNWEYHYTTLCGYFDIIEYLDGKLLFSDFDLRKLLHYSILEGAWKTIDYISKKHVKIKDYFITNKDKVFLMNPILRKDINTVRVLLKNGYYDEDKEKYLDKCIKYNELEIADLFINEGLLDKLNGPSEKEYFKNLKNLSPGALINKSIDDDFLTGVKYAIKEYLFKLDWYAILQIACFKERIKIIKYLLKEYDYPIDERLNSVINFCKTDETKKLIQDFIDKKTNIKEGLNDYLKGPSEEELEENTKDLDPWKKRDIFIENNYGKGLKIILDKYPILLNTLLENNYRIFRDCVNENKVDVVRVMLEHGANPNYLSGDCIVKSVINGNYEMVKLLIEFGGDIDKCYLNLVRRSKELGFTDIYNLLKDKTERYIYEGVLDKLSGLTEDDIINNLKDKPQELLNFSLSNKIKKGVELALKNGAKINRLFKSDLYKLFEIMNYTDDEIISKISNDDLLVYGLLKNNKYLIKYSLNHGAQLNYDVIKDLFYNNYEIFEFIANNVEGFSVSENLMKEFIINDEIKNIKKIVKLGCFDIYWVGNSLLRYAKKLNKKDIIEYLLGIGIKEGVLQHLTGPNNEDIKKYYKQKFLDGRMTIYEYINKTKKLKIEPFTFDELKESYKTGKLKFKDFITVCYSLGYSELCREEFEDEIQDILTKIVETGDNRFDINDIKTKLKLSNSYIFSKIKNININDKMLLCADLMLISELRKCIENGADISYKNYQIVNILKTLVHWNKKAKPLLDYVFSLIGLPDTYQEYLEDYFSGCELKTILVKNYSDKFYHALVKKGEVIIYSMLPNDFYIVIKNELYFTLYNFYEIHDNIHSSIKEYLIKNNLNEWLGFNEERYISFRLSNFKEVNEILNEGVLQHLKGPSEEEITTSLENDSEIENETEMFIKCCIIGYLNGVKKAVKDGAEYNKKYRNSIVRIIDDSFIDACENNHYEVAKYLIELGANVNSDYSRGLMMSVQENHYEIVKLILENGGSITKVDSKTDLLFDAIMYCDYKMFKLLFNNYIKNNIVNVDKINKYIEIADGGKEAIGMLLKKYLLVTHLPVKKYNVE